VTVILSWIEVFALRKTYTDEYKRLAVERALGGEKTKRQTARELGLHAGLLYRWIEEFGPNAVDRVDLVVGDQHAEVLRLRKALARSEMERDILKKAIGIFSEEQE
jgi:transposase